MPILVKNNHFRLFQTKGAHLLGGCLYQEEYGICCYHDAIFISVKRYMYKFLEEFVI